MRIQIRLSLAAVGLAFAEPIQHQRRCDVESLSTCIKEEVVGETQDLQDDVNGMKDDALKAPGFCVDQTIQAITGADHEKPSDDDWAGFEHRCPQRLLEFLQGAALRETLPMTLQELPSKLRTALEKCVAVGSN
ncbi:hypothetical protein BDV38DRAFT_279163 [Aspergillus pseudotamarii]|uniref:Secreted protein n=1 Tax=Aspergillus pseudotamarii TaxID=132259 RepID=A0A5N6T4M3_ASPPS|nr:uncharacterized protein BDV38DRAFT_279163 [Aspergillus pseudotamarii]KAE8141257.1 hypothetical protein BDV38DRAFT_279163 [Aspergillus pseudotamarii]